MRKKLHHIKKAKTGGYQIQFIVDGKSHSGFAMKRKDAIKIRDQMGKELAVEDLGYRKKPLQHKGSFIPGTEEHMPAGIGLRTYTRPEYEEYYIQVNWINKKGKQSTKSFYACRDSTFSMTKLKETYNRAAMFRRAYEKAKREGTMNSFDPTQFNLQNLNKTKNANN